MQSEAALPEKRPAPHVSHPVPAIKLLKRPAVQVAHVEDPCPALYLPEEQVEQAVFPWVAWKRPGSHDCKGSEEGNEKGIEVTMRPGREA